MNNYPNENNEELRNGNTYSTNESVNNTSDDYSSYSNEKYDYSDGYGNPQEKEAYDFETPQHKTTQYNGYSYPQSNSADTESTNVYYSSTSSDNIYSSTQPYTQSTQYSQQNHSSTSAQQYGYTQSPSDNANIQTAYNPVYTQQGYRYTSASQPTKKKKKGNGAIAAVLVVCILISGVLGFGGGLLANRLTATTTPDGGLTVQKVVNTAEGVSKTDTSGTMTTEQVAEAVADSVVEITTEVVQTGSFTRQYITSGAGSGVIISENGYIVTNNHVIEDASKITVTLKNGTSYDAAFIGTAYPTVDIALIKIDAANLKPAVLGDSDSLKVGQDAVVIGNPLGQLGGSVTNGILSSLSRDLSIDGVTMNLLQTDAAINPGNSGGGMFNTKGELIGIVVAKSTATEIEGLGFAIPVNQVSDVLGDLTEYGYVRGIIEVGMSMIDITSNQMAMMYRVDETGVYVQSVERGSAAEDAGLQSGDRIISIDGTEVSTSDDVKAVFKEHKVGDKVKVKVARGSQSGEVELTLTESVPDELRSNSQDNNSGFNENNDDYYGDSLQDIFDSIF